MHIAFYCRACKPGNNAGNVPPAVNGTKENEALTKGMSLQSKLLKAKQKKVKNLTILSTEEEELMKKVNECEAEIVSIAHIMAQKTREDIKKQYTTLKEEVTKECDEMEDPLKAIHEFIEKIDNSAKRFDLSVGKRVLKTGNELLEKIAENPWTRHLTYKFNKEIVANLKKYDSFGKVYEKGPEKLTLAGAVLQNMKVRLSGDTKDCDISNIDAAADGTFLLTDYNNKKLKRVRLFLKVQDWIEVPGSPMSVCHISKSEVAVSLREERKIQFVSTEKPMKLTTSFSTPDKCNRLCYDEDTDELYVCLGGKLYDSVGMVQVYDKSGKRKRIFGKGMFSTPVDIKLNKATNILCVADRENGVFVLDTLGNVKWSVTNQSLYKTWGVSEVIDDQVYTCGNGSNNVCALAKDGQVISKIDSVPGPICLYLNREKKVLLVGLPCDSVRIYTLNTEPKI